MPRKCWNTGRCWGVNRARKQETANRKQGREKSKYEPVSSLEGAIKFSLAACKHSTVAKTRTAQREAGAEPAGRND